MDIGKMLAGLIAISAVGFIYFIPAIVAKSHKKRNFQAILAVNLFFGWTLIGWVIALVWALTQDK